jgi:putative transposase
MAKLTDKGVRWIIDQIRMGELSIRQIAKHQDVTSRRIRQIRQLYLQGGEIPQLKWHTPIPKPSDPTEVKLIKKAKIKYKVGATSLEHIIEKKEGKHIPHNRIHRILKEENLAEEQPNKQKRRKWVRYERKHSNSMWHTDWTELENGKQIIIFEDDASRMGICWGEFDEATTENSLIVLKKGIKKHGKPRSILTGRDTQFFMSEREGITNGKTEFQRFLEEQGIRHIVGRVNHPQTNGKQERLFGTVKRHYDDFAGLDELMHWYNEIRPHMSLDWDNLETPSQAFIRKMHHKDRRFRGAKK